MTSPLPGVRLDRLIIENFKCFEGHHDIALDADLIMLVGANGRGKTSLVEAIELALTGELQQRMGDPIEFKLLEYINRRSRAREDDSAASVKAVWAKGMGSGTIRLTSYGEKEAAREGQFKERFESGRWEEDEARLRLLQSSTFLYSDHLGSLIGLDQGARKRVLDLFIPGTPHLSQLAKEEATALLQAAEARKAQVGLPDLEYLRSRRNECAKTLEQSWNEVPGVGGQGKPALLTTRKGVLKAEREVDKALKECVRQLEPNRDVAKLARQMLLQTLAEAAKTRRDEAAGVQPRPASLPEESWKGIEEALQALASFQQQLNRLSDGEGLYSKTEMQLNRLLAEAETELERKERALQRFWQNDIVAHPGLGDVRAAVGTVPLLRSLLRLKSSGVLEMWLGENDLSFSTVPRLEELLEQEMLTWTMDQATLNDAREHLRRLHAEREYYRLERAIQAQMSALAVFWRELEGGEPLPLLASGMPDATRIRALRPSSILIQSEPGAVVRWERLAAAAEAWGAVETKLEAAIRTHQENPERQELLAQIEAIGEIAQWINAPYSDFDVRLKSQLVGRLYQDKFNDATGRILQRYAHVDDVRRRVSISIEKSLTLHVKDKDNHFISSGLPTLSRSQLSSIALSMGIAAHLGHPDLLSGFFCLDDVSDAFDLANLAADANILRALAYEEGPTRRQLILTNHNEHLTDRLVPLLLPPAGRSMRIIELRDDPKKGVSVKSWRVKGESNASWTGRSPLRELIPEG